MQQIGPNYAFDTLTQTVAYSQSLASSKTLTFQESLSVKTGVQCDVGIIFGEVEYLEY